MAIIGNTTTSVPFIADSFSGNASTTSFSPLTRAPAGTAAIAVFIAGVYQAPGTYTLSGVTITFASAPASGVGNIIVLHLGTGSVTQVTSDGSVTLTKLSGDTFSYINSAFTTANSSGSYANAAFATANTGTASGSYANSAFATANTVTSASSYANSAFSVANNGVGIDATQNTNITSAGAYANGAFIKANSSVSLTANVSGTLPVGNGGTGAATLTSNNVLLGNGSSAVQFVAPGSNGNLLTSNGTTWTSAAASGGVTSVNGQTGAVVLTNAGDIGSIGIFQNSGNADLAYGATIAGSTLRHGHSNNGGATNPSSPSFAGFRQRQNSASYDGGGTSLSGTWRKLATEKIYATQANCCGTLYAWYHSLYIRIS